MDNTLIGFCAEYSTTYYVCTNKLCEHTWEETELHNLYSREVSRILTEKTVCPECGFKTGAPSPFPPDFLAVIAGGE